MIRDFPYSENALIQQIVRTLAPVKIVSIFAFFAKFEYDFNN